MSNIKKIDHLVITTAKPEECLSFYETLGFEVVDAGGRYELFAGDFKINVHILHQELLPHAQNVQIGSADLCFEINEDLKTFRDYLLEKGIVLESDIVTRHGVKGTMNSIYLRDPDGNLIEFSSY